MRALARCIRCLRCTSSAAIVGFYRHRSNAVNYGSSVISVRRFFCTLFSQFYSSLSFYFFSVSFLSSSLSSYNSPMFLLPHSHHQSPRNLISFPVFFFVDFLAVPISFIRYAQRSQMSIRPFFVNHIPKFQENNTIF